MMLAVPLYAILALSGFPTHSASATKQVARDSMVNVGTHKLHFRVISGKGPVVLFEAGGGEAADEWDGVAPKLAAQTGATVVAYDRGGFGESELPNRDYDIRQEVGDLWRGLKVLGLTHSLVLVGHSYGGFLIQLLAHDHPNAVKRCLFIDPNNVPFIDAIGGVDALTKVLNKLSPPSADAEHPKKPTNADQANARVLAAFPTTVDVLRNVTLPKTVTNRVITAGKGWWPTADLNQSWRESHDKLAKSVPGGRMIIAEQSDHNIPQEQPDLIVETIEEMLHAPAHGSSK